MSKPLDPTVIDEVISVIQMHSQKYNELPLDDPFVYSQISQDLESLEIPIDEDTIRVASAYLENLGNNQNILGEYFEGGIESLYWALLQSTGKVDGVENVFSPKIKRVVYRLYELSEIYRHEYSEIIFRGFSYVVGANENLAPHIDFAKENPERYVQQVIENEERIVELRDLQS